MSSLFLSRPLSSPFTRALPLLLLTALAAGAYAKSSSGELAPIATAAEPAAPWWSAFREPALVELQQAAAANASQATAPLLARADDASDAPLDIQVASDYLGMRLLNVRAMLADEMLRTIARQRVLMAGTAPLRTQTPPLAALDSELTQARRRVEELTANRDTLIADLARLCGTTPDALRARLQQVLADSSLPALDLATPAGAPIAARSSDVFEDLQVRDLEARQHRVRQLTEQTRTWLEIVRTRQLELEAARQRMALGAQPEFSVLATYRVMLVDNDRLADSVSELAKAWLQLHLQDAARPLQASGRLSD